MWYAVNRLPEVGIVLCLLSGERVGGTLKLWWKHCRCVEYAYVCFEEVRDFTMVPHCQEFSFWHIPCEYQSDKCIWRLRSIKSYGIGGHKSGPGCALWLTYSKAYKINRMTKLMIVFLNRRGKGKVETQHKKSNRCDSLEIFCHQVSSNVFHIENCILKWDVLEFRVVHISLKKMAFWRTVMLVMILSHQYYPHDWGPHFDIN